MFGRNISLSFLLPPDSSFSLVLAVFLRSSSFFLLLLFPLFLPFPPFTDFLWWLFRSLNVSLPLPAKQVTIAEPFIRLVRQIVCSSDKQSSEIQVLKVGNISSGARLTYVPAHPGQYFIFYLTIRNLQRSCRWRTPGKWKDKYVGCHI